MKKQLLLITLLFYFLPIKPITCTLKPTTMSILSIVDSIEICCNSVNSKIDHLSSGITTSCDLSLIDSKIDLIEECCNSVNSKIDQLSMGITVTVSCDFSQLNSKIDLLGLCNAIPLTVTSSTNIVSPGVYCLTQDVTPGSSIEIDVSNVILDLNGHTAYNIVCFGSFITIKNGAIVGDTTLPGIDLTSGGIYIKLFDLCISFCSYGIDINGSQKIEIDRVISAQNSNDGIRIQNASELNMNNCAFINNIVNGFSLNTCSSINLFNCVSKTNFGPGFICSNSMFTFDSCFAVNNNQEGFRIEVINPNNTASLINCVSQSNSNFGFNFTGSANFIGYSVEKCLALANFTNGFEIATPRGIFTECISTENQSALANGFHIATSFCLFENCQTTNNKFNGFLLDGANDNCSISRCFASGNSINGFDLSAAGVCTVIGDCRATSNTGFGFIGNSGAPTNVTFYSNFAACNGTNFDDLSASSAESGMLDSKIDALTSLVNNDFLGTFTQLDIINNTTLTILSKIDDCCFSLNSAIDSLSSTITADFAGTFTVLDTIENLVIDKSFSICSKIQQLGLCNPIPLVIGPAGATINSSGVYCLASDVNLGATNTIAINATQNVVLDLNGHTITTSGTAITLTVSQKISIQNGFIVGALRGIQVLSPSSELEIHDLELTNCSTCLEMLSTSSNVLLQRITMNSPSSFGLSVTGPARNYIVEDCIVFGSGLGTPVGFNIAPSAFLVAVQKGFTFTRCSCTNIDSAFKTFDSDATFDSCQSDNNTNGFFATSSLTTGLNVNFINCLSKGNGGGFGFEITAGMGDTSSRFVLENCIAQSHNNGFILTNRTQGLIINSSAEFNASNGFDCSGINWIFRDCVAGNNGLTGFNFTVADTGCVVQGCTASGNNVGFAGPGIAMDVSFYLNSAVHNGAFDYTPIPLNTKSAPVASLIDCPCYGNNLVS